MQMSLLNGFMNTMKDDLYASHLPILAKVVEKSTGPILELGVGHSTLLLHVMCKQEQRLIVSYETDPVWYEKYRKFETDWHQVKLIRSMNDIAMDYVDWGVVFIDHRPGVNRRTQAIRFRNKAQYILLHDSEPEQNKFFGYQKIYPEFKYVYQYTKAKPNTAVLSEFRDLSDL